MKQFILMADVISSRNYPSKNLINDFKSIVQSTNKKYKASMSSPLTITLGDEFQGVIKDLKSSISIILYMEEECIRRKFDFKLRFVVNQGEIDTMVNNKIAYEMLGAGLTYARSKLIEIKDTADRFCIILEDAFTSGILNNAFKVFQNIISKWKLDQDYEMAYNFILYRDYKKVAEVMERNRSLIWKREKSLEMDSYYAIKNIIQQISQK